MRLSVEKKNSNTKKNIGDAHMLWFRYLSLKFILPAHEAHDYTPYTVALCIQQHKQ